MEAILRHFVLASLLFSSACVTADGGAAPEQRPQEVRPWKPYFKVPQSLVADELYVEGPEGVLEHIALGHDSAAHIYTTETTPDGLLQVVELRPGINPASAPIRIQMDALDMRILRRVTVLERVGVPPVEVRASGNVWWAREDGLGEVRRQQLTLPRDLPRELLEASAPRSKTSRALPPSPNKPSTESDEQGESPR